MWAGARFGSLTLWRATKLGRHAAWVCLCDCGTVKVIRSANLRTGNSKTCGGHSHRVRNVLAGGRGSKTYNSWRAMRKRCLDPKNVSYPNYGGKGVKVCKRWLPAVTGYAAFVKDMGERPPNTTLDRKDPRGNYDKYNCRWATAIEQEHNKRRSHEQFVDDLREFDYWDQQEAAYLNAGVVN